MASLTWDEPSEQVNTTNDGDIVVIDTFLGLKKLKKFTHLKKNKLFF